MRKSMSKPVAWKAEGDGFLISLQIIACKEENVKLLHFLFKKKCITPFKTFNEKQNEPLQDTLRFMAAELR